MAEEEAALASRGAVVAAGDIGDTDELGSAGAEGEEDGETYPYDDGDDDEDIEAELEHWTGRRRRCPTGRRRNCKKSSHWRQSFAARGPPAVAASASALLRASDVVVGQRTVLRSGGFGERAAIVIGGHCSAGDVQPQTGQHSWGYRC